MKISLYDALAQFGRMLQGRLFPALAEQAGPLGEKHQQLIAVLSLIGMEGHLDGNRGGRGRPAHDRLAFGRAFVAKAVFNLPVLEPHDANSHVLNQLFTVFVFVLMIFMYFPINFNHKTSLVAIEIGNKESFSSVVINKDGMLPVKLQVAKPAVA